MSSHIELESGVVHILSIIYLLKWKEINNMSLTYSSFYISISVTESRLLVKDRTWGAIFL